MICSTIRAVVLLVDVFVQSYDIWLTVLVKNQDMCMCFDYHNRIVQDINVEKLIV